MHSVPVTVMGIGHMRVLMAKRCVPMHMAVLSRGHGVMVVIVMAIADLLAGFAARVIAQDRPGLGRTVGGPVDRTGRPGRAGGGWRDGERQALAVAKFGHRCP